MTDSDNGRVIAESGAIIDYILRRHGNGRLQPDPASAAYDDHVHWLHYTKGSAMPALILKITVSRLGDAGASLGPHLDNELSSHLGYINDKLEGRNYLLGDELTAADIQLSFFGELASARTGIASYSNIGAWVNRFQARPPYKAALERGGAHSFA
jgi:glutathione S-transferase